MQCNDLKDSLLPWIVLSIIIHLIIITFFHLIILPEKNSILPIETKILNEEKRINITLLPKEDQSIINEISTKDDSLILKSILKTDERICSGKDNSYIGVGFLWTPVDNIIVHAPEYYPAYRAGIREGDIVLNPEDPIINGYIRLNIIRSGERLEFNIKVDNICFQNN